MDKELWTKVDRYFESSLVVADPVLDAVLADSRSAGLPAINVSPCQGQLLHILAKSCRAATILEIGTLAGYSTIWLARALPSGGRLITLEADPAHAAIARANFQRAGLADTIELRLGPAIDTLPEILAEGRGPFDLVFIDADKPSTPDYFQWAMRVTKPGGLIVVDNVVRKGAIIDPHSDDQNVRGVRRFVEIAAAEPRVRGTAIQTVGSKDYDGFAIFIVIA
jgi:predicted O-methyltransferase YrrM